MDCLVQQTLRSAGHSREGPCILQSVAHCETGWLTSAVQWVQDAGLTLSYHSSTDQREQFQILTLYPTMVKEDLDLLHLHNATTVAEVTMVGDPPCPVYQSLITKYSMAAWPDVPIRIKPGQIWQIKRGAEASYRIYEVYGFQSDSSVNVVEWFDRRGLGKANNVSTEVGATLVTQIGIDSLCGAGWTTSIALDELVHVHDSKLLLLTVNTNKSTGNYQAKVLSIKPRLTSWAVKRTSACPPNREAFEDWLSVPCKALYTDASWSREQTPLQWLLDEGAVTAQGAIIRDDGWNGYQHLVVRSESLKHQSAFSCEMLQQLIAVNCSSAKVVRTDCKSAMKIVRQGRLKPVNKQRMEMLRITGQKHRLGWGKLPSTDQPSPPHLSRQP